MNAMKMLLIVVACAAFGASAEGIKVDSPFALKLGSDELAMRFPKAVTRSHSVTYDGPSKGARPAWTNWHRRASVTFTRPYHLFRDAELNFRETDKKLYSYNLHADCPETMTREECVKTLEKVVADLNAHYGLKLKLQARSLTKTEEGDLKGRRGHCTTFAQTGFDFLGFETTNTVHANVYGMVNGKGGMSAGVHVYDSDLQADVYTRRGRFFESSKAVAGGSSEPLALPLGYHFGDIYTNAETVAVVPEELTNWPASFGWWEGREVPLVGKWRNFDSALFRLSEYGRISSFAAVLATNGIVSVEALETWARGVLESKRDELELSFMGGDRLFYPQRDQTNDYRTAFMSCHSRSLGMGRMGVSSSVKAEAKRLDDGRAFLRISFSTDDAKKLDAPKRQSEGEGIRRALKDLLGLDFKSEQPKWAGCAGASEWQRLDVQKGMFTEWRPWFDEKTGCLRNASLRCTYEGDVSKKSLSNDVQKLVRSIEAVAGQKLRFQDGDMWFGLFSRRVRFGDVLSYGDYLGGVPPTCTKTAKVGDMSIEISYAVPQYVKDGDRYVLAMKGGIIFRAGCEVMR